MRKGVKQILVKLKDASYSIYIGNGLLEGIGEYLNVAASKYILVTDHQVEKLYGDRFIKALKENKESFGLVYMYSFEAGEKSKVLATKVLIEEFMFENGFGKDSCLIAFGGGVVGDISGYVASTFCRGIPYVQVPTTLIGQVDSSIGGKTGLNVLWGKNLIGTLYQPKAVIVDLDLLESLSDREYYAGMAEVIKIAVIADETLFWYLKQNVEGLRGRFEDCIGVVVERSCELKKRIVEQDETDVGFRRVLNFGHTIGHSLEKVMDYQWLHGECVALGMLVEGYISCCLGYMGWEDLGFLEGLFEEYGLAKRMPGVIDFEAVYNATFFDKKAIRGRPYYSFVCGIGKMMDKENQELRYGVEVSKELVLEALVRYKELT